MARRPRQIVSGRTYHLAQRGHADEPFCIDAQDREAYLNVFLESAMGNGLWIHAWSVVGREAHWLVTPQRARAMAETIQQVGRRYVPIFNRRWRRSGTPWEGRYRSYWISADVHGLSAMRWLAWQPVRAGLCADPLDWPWSSAGVLAGQRPAPPMAPIQTLAGYWSLGNTPFEREAAFARILQEPMDASLVQGMEKGLASGCPLLTERDWARLPPGERLSWIGRPRGRPRGVNGMSLNKEEARTE